MGGLRVMQLWRAAGGPAFALYLVAVVAALVRVVDQPSLDVEIAGTDVSLVPADAAFAALLVVVIARLARGWLPAGPARAVLLAAAAFAAWLGLSALPNGATAIVATGRLLELGILALATAVLVDRRERLWLLVGTLLLVTVAAVGVAFVGFLQDPGGRQASFLGEHDLAALSSMSLGVGLAAAYAHRRLEALPLAALVVGALGVTLGAALASVLGVYLVAGAIAAVAAVRGAFHRRALVVTLVVLACVTAGTSAIRSGELGFLQVLTRQEEEHPGQYAASWSQRLIYAYVGLRVFEDNPIAGTGWYPLLPPEEFAEYVPDARSRFDNQPARYFPPTDRSFIPQQTPDQVLYELGLVGAALFLLLAVAVVRSAWRTARTWPRGPDDLPAYLPAAWTASLAGVLAGAALYGGTPIAAIFWLTIGAVAATASLEPATVAAEETAEAQRLAGAAR
jgi:O-Antigen ligase